LTRDRVRNPRPHPTSLDAVNFLLADMRGVHGRYLNVFVLDDAYRPRRCP